MNDSPSDPIRLARFIFALPEPVDVPDGFRVIAPIGNHISDPPRDDDPVVDLTFHQLNVPGGRGKALLRATKRTLRKAGLVSSRRTQDGALRGFRVPVTVIDAVTLRDSPDPMTEVAHEHPHLRPSRSDPVNACIAQVDRVIRGLRQASSSTLGMLTYARIPGPIMTFRSTGRIVPHPDPRGPVATITADTAWVPDAILMLNHRNMADPYPQDVGDRLTHEKLEYWIQQYSRGSPFTIWRERYLDARRALEVTGDLAPAVILAHVSCETLMRTLAILLRWEAGDDAEDAARDLNAHPNLRAMIDRELVPRLAGNWWQAHAAPAQWSESTAALRHRIVHAGYLPNPAEAQRAVESAADLHGFLFDRLADQRTAYPRSALLALGSTGLDKRGMWKGQIRQFAEPNGPLVPGWHDAFAGYYAAVANLIRH